MFVFSSNIQHHLASATGMILQLISHVKHRALEAALRLVSVERNLVFKETQSTFAQKRGMFDEFLTTSNNSAPCQAKILCLAIKDTTCAQRQHIALHMQLSSE